MAFKFIRQKVDGTPTPEDIVKAWEEYSECYAVHFERMDKIYDPVINDTVIFKRGLDNETIEKVKFPIARYIVTILSNYMLGDQPKYSAYDDADSIIESFVHYIKTAYRRQAKRKTDKCLRTTSGKYGFSYELAYYDEDSLTPKSIELPPEYTFVVFDYSYERNSVYAVNIAATGKNEYQIYVYTDEERIVYKAKELAVSGNFQEVERTYHYMGRVPVTMYLNNADGKGDYEDVAPLINALNGIATDERYDIKRTVDALLVFLNTKLSGATVEEKSKVRDAMRYLGILELNNDDTNPGINVDVKPISNPLNIAGAEQFVDRLWTAIFRLSGVPDPTDNNYFSSLSGIAIKMQAFLGLEPYVKNSEGEFDYAFRRRMKMYNYFENLRGRQELVDAGDVKIEFNHTMPTNDLETAQIISLIDGRGLVGKETLSNQLSFVDDPAEEVANAQAETATDTTNDLLMQLSQFSQQQPADNGDTS
jgi:SPP1 family phage portal protein